MHVSFMGFRFCCNDNNDHTVFLGSPSADFGVIILENIENFEKLLKDCGIIENIPVPVYF